MIHSARKLGFWTKLAIAGSVAAVVLVAVAALVIRHAGGILKGRISLDGQHSTSTEPC
jgi:hypothetical protein